MNLLLQRDQRRTFLRTIEYSVHVSLICTARELELIQDHNLGRNQMYAVPEVEANKQQAQNAFDRGAHHSLFNSNEAGKILTDNLSGIYHTAKAHFSFTVTVNDAIRGIKISCPDLTAMVDCDREIQTAFDDLGQDVQNAFAFATGREQLLAPNGEEEPEGLPPAAWGDPQQWFTGR